MQTPRNMSSAKLHAEISRRAADAGATILCSIAGQYDTILGGVDRRAAGVQCAFPPTIIRAGTPLVIVAFTGPRPNYTVNAPLVKAHCGFYLNYLAGDGLSHYTAQASTQTLGAFDRVASLFDLLRIFVLPKFAGAPNPTGPPELSDHITLCVFLYRRLLPHVRQTVLGPFGYHEKSMLELIRAAQEEVLHPPPSQGKSPALVALRAAGVLLAVGSVCWACGERRRSRCYAAFSSCAPRSQPYSQPS
jgi:hypothetical protein